MSDSRPEEASGVFGAAARAGQYVEADTVVVSSSSSRRMHTALSMGGQTPSYAAEPLASSAVATLVAVPPVPDAQGDPEVAKPAVHTRAESLSVLFGGGPAGLTPAGPPPERATEGWRSVLARVGLPVGPGPAEQAAFQRREQCAADEAIVRQATWTRAVWILVNNKKGGSGKTPVALDLGGLIAAIRGGSAAIFEASDDPGALNLRAEGNPRIGLGELVRDVDRVTTAGQLAGYTAPQTSFASVIGTVGLRPALTGTDVVKVAEKIGQFYSVGVMDSGNVPTSSAFQGAVSVADILVMPVMNAGDSVYEAIEVLDVLRAGDAHARALASNAIVVRLKDGRPESEPVAAEVARLLTEAGVKQIYEIPYDGHIADRGQLTLDKLAPATREAFLSAAAGVVRSLQATVSTEA